MKNQIYQRTIATCPELDKVKARGHFNHHYSESMDVTEENNGFCIFHCKEGTTRFAGFDFDRDRAIDRAREKADFERAALGLPEWQWPEN